MSRQNRPPSQDTADLPAFADLSLVCRESWPVLRRCKTDRQITDEANLLNATAWPGSIGIDRTERWDNRTRDELALDGLTLPAGRRG